MKTVCRSTIDEEMTMNVIALTSAILSISASASAWGADIRAGETLAKQWCSACHVVSADQTTGGDDAPAFATIAAGAREREADLRAWLADSHPPMPNLDLSRNEIDDLLAYIESLGGS